MGANEPPIGAGVKAVPTMSVVRSGFTARFGSLSWFVSPESEAGIMLTTRTVPILLASVAAQAVELLRRLEILRMEERKGRGFGQVARGGVEEPEASLRGLRLRDGAPLHVDAVRIQHRHLTGLHVPLLDVKDVDRRLPPLGVVLRRDGAERPGKPHDAPNDHRVRAGGVLAHLIGLDLAEE